MNEYRWEDLKVGLRHELEVTVTADQMKAFVALSGDTNPMHVDPAFAAKAGFPGVVVFGMLTSSFYSQLVGVLLPGRYAFLQGIDLDFANPAFVGDVLTVSGEITYLMDAYKRMEIKGRITNQAGKAISKAKIRVGLNAP